MNPTKAKLRKGLILGASLAVLVPLVGVTTATAMAHAGYTVIANLTPSVPGGLYLANQNSTALSRGQIVSFFPHNAAAEHGFKRGWIKPGGAYIKRVAALAGDMVCVDAELAVATNGVGEPATYTRFGPVAEADREGRPLPHELSGCTRVPSGYFLPVGDALPNSFDGRYYGFVPVDKITARLFPLWVDSDGKE